MDTKIYAVGRGRLFNSSYHSHLTLLQHVDAVRQKLDRVARQWWLPRFVRDQARLMFFELRPVAGGTAGNAFETDVLELFFNATALADLADDDQTSPATTLTVALHTADPGEAGDQTTNEAAYTSYARETVARTGGGWSVASGSVSPVANISFTTSTGSGSTITHFSVGTGVSNYLMCSGTVTPNIAVGGSGITPILTTSTAITLD